MSYILDALRRADAERQRGQTPALQQVTQGVPVGTAATAPAPSRVAWTALVLLMLIGLVVSAAWWFWRAPVAPMVALPASAPAGASGPTSTPTPPANATAIGAPAPVVTAVPRSPAAPLAVPVPPFSGPSVAPAPAPSPLPTSAPATAARIAAPATAQASVVAAPIASAPAPRPIPASALPEPQRSAVARLAFGGAVHSQDRSQSFVMLAGQIVREGEVLAPGITLERITPRALLLRVAEHLVEVAL